jgi:putative flippase GtrA
MVPKESAVRFRKGTFACFGRRPNYPARLERIIPQFDSLSQFTRFLVVGVANTALSFIAYRLLLAVATPYVVAAFLGFGAGALNGYVFNRRWTFAARDSTRARVLYVAVQATGAISASLLVLLFHSGAGVGKVGAYLAAIPPVTVCTFVANRVWTFADRG